MPDVFTEKDLENSILNQLLEFLKELGSDFTFVDRQETANGWRSERLFPGC